MKTLLFNIALVLFTVSNVLSQTNVSGPYFTNTTWGISGSPYNVIGDVQIPAGVILSIDPGCQINFTGNYEILIKGTILANGTNLLPIQFIGSSTGISMLMFKSTNLTNCQLTNLEFTGPKNAIQLADEGEFNEDLIKNSGTLTISNAIFTNTTVKTKGYQTPASLVVDNTTITGSTIIGVYPRSEPITIKNSTLDNNTINSDAYNYGITMDSCLITNSSLLIGCCGANININQSKITSSSIIDGMGSPVTGPLIISNSELNNTPINLPSATVNISNSVANTNSSSGIIFGNGVIECTKQTGSGTGTAFTITGYDGYNIGGSVSIINTTISQNSIGIKISNANTVSCDSSNFFNNATYNVENLSIKAITAKNNWWGTNVSAVIASTIFDYYDNITFGIIDFSNYLGSIYNSSICPDTLLLPTAIPFDDKNTITQNMLDFDIYPNPATEWSFIKIQDEIKARQNASLEIYTITGQVFYYHLLNNQKNSELLNLSSYPKGIYFVKVKNENDFRVKKLIVY